MKRFIEDIKKHDAAPFLFLGSGFSRRYIGSPKWDDLLKECASWTNKNYKQYVSKVKEVQSDDPMFLPHIAKLIAEEFEDIWWNDESYDDISKENENDIKDYASPLKIATAKYLEKFNLLNCQKDMEKEISALKKLAENNSIDGVITTNWDCLAEEIFGFERFIGQKALLFSNVLNVGEIFKIHGCITEPNSMIFDANDYDSFNKRNHYLASKLTTIFIEHPIVFIGYSLRDSNIREILNAIIYGIGEESLKKFGKRIFFLEYDFEDGDFIYTTMPVDLPDGTLEITYIKTHDFAGVFEALGENERKFSAKLVRQMKSYLYELLLTDDPKDQIYVASDVDSKIDFDEIQFVYGAGIIEKLSNTGYSVIPNDELLKDIVGLSEKKYDYKKIVEETLLTANKYHLPVHYFIHKSGLDISSIDNRIIKRSVKSHKSLLNSKRSVENINQLYKSLTDLTNKEGIDKSLEYALYIYPEKIDKDELKELIVSNINLLDHGKTTQKTSIRKLIKYYDWLKYRKPKKGELILKNQKAEV
ncbi:MULTISPECIES: SIR2 family protein [Bacillus]|uniref:SIR2 family protein n=1 Tax=Bacillus TaxID=1386 RepID=UPI000B4BEBE6|nr:MULTISPECIES: SIR2 family protein [Bacillus cereus group]MCU5202171.1 SIR2 family protein [Bacillus paranthracis]MDA2630916.1 SIR2 family protein [Bacillus cereus]MDC2944289.1 SIR2 family protein [Bacillus thuringiensis]PRC96263.1 hypothetical protein CQZ92_23665 [Bacillus cereus]PRD01449.1 hypothetical protein CQZ91_26390 [Bacillus cereus]